MGVKLRAERDQNYRWLPDRFSATQHGGSNNSSRTPEGHLSPVSELNCRSDEASRCQPLKDSSASSG